MIHVIGTNISNEQAQAHFEAAKAYLIQSDLAEFLINQLDAIPEILTINVSKSTDTTQANTWGEVDGTAGTINWNVLRVLKTRSSACEMSPPLLLMHEMGHACQYMSGQKGEMLEGLTLERRNLLENIDVSAIENTVANELREKGCPEGVRENYEDAQL
ncbi:M91 family zinc metallopeptidase [Vibrio europaeus]|uniref:M91 family zinc metallopeptidase n=1 Tax=Vibrio europaeus TaxID=300876 RepID=UPI00233E622E|nr:M91 family zinc metallopeptidase [Vibrio europaeus]MDC5853905.1 type III secretion system effector protein [Vibrio europaeus]